MRGILGTLVVMIGGLGLMLDCAASRAGSLQVTPVLIDVQVPAAASKLELRNVGPNLLNAQIRVYRWTQEGGADHLVETRDVVVSPPLAQVPANGEQLVRIVRLSKQPVRGEESYRLIIDELPQSNIRKGASVNFSLRYSVPVFFGAATDRLRPPEWQVSQQAGRLLVTATNGGDRRIRISRLKISSSRVGTVSFGNGLAGYVLARSSVQLPNKPVVARGVEGSTVDITAQTENGPVLATAVVQAP